MKKGVSKADSFRRWSEVKHRRSAIKQSVGGFDGCVSAHRGQFWTGAQKKKREERQDRSRLADTDMIKLLLTPYWVGRFRLMIPSFLSPEEKEETESQVCAPERIHHQPGQGIRPLGSCCVCSHAGG